MVRFGRQPCFTNSPSTLASSNSTTMPEIGSSAPLTQAAKGNHGGRPKVIDDDMLTIKSGKNAGKHPSVASLYRALAEAGDGAAQPDEAPGIWRPVPARITGPGSGIDHEL